MVTTPWSGLTLASSYEYVFTATATYYIPASVTESFTPGSPPGARTYDVGVVYWALASTSRHLDAAVPDDLSSVLGSSASVLSSGTSVTGGSTTSATAGSTASSETSPSAGGVTSSPSPTTSSSGKKTTNAGLIAAIAVLAALFVLSLVALGFIILSRRKKHLRPNTHKGAQHEQEEISRLQHHANLEERHRSLITAAVHHRGPEDDSLSEQGALKRFDQLENSITTWVHTYFGDIPSDRTRSPDLATLVPDYEILLKTRRTQFLVIRAAVAQILTEGFRTGEFLGEAFRGLSGVLREKASSEEFSGWRVQAISLLSDAPSWTAERSDAITAITLRINSLLSPLTPSPPNPERQAFLEQLVQTASLLAVDLASQYARYEVSVYPSFLAREGRVGVLLFEPGAMEDVFQESESEVAGREVRLVVSPLVVRYPGAVGRMTIIKKAKVLV
ncbi:hypothetical protein FGG08_003714 [Glutinoglossum americanum]|uniref:Uncharacterized protein n=1 Tax=Glutinoglossum americanum TaxID=1670608 RepID=A0A9P8I6J2_9PEZI|nr:hypothetical protein FGG08_003714 [Glutinoglossum americanum]